MAEIIHKADVSYSTFRNIFRAKDGVPTEPRSVFGSYLPDATERGFYDMEIGSASVTRGRVTGS